MPSRATSCLLAVLVAGLAIPAAPRGAAAQVSWNVTFHSSWNLRSGYNDCWGYTAPNGDEYALLGMYSGTSVINLTDPDNPYETQFIPGPGSTWRDIKTYQHYAYVVNESSGGLQIIDLADPENPVALASYTGFSRAHNLYIDVPTARLFTAGSNLGAGGTRILSLANPTAPVEVGSWETQYLHDVMVQNDRLYGSAIYVPALYVLDVSNLASITTIGTIRSYPNAFTHNAWVTPDDNFVMTTDEVTGAACRMWDITGSKTSLNAQLASLYLPNPSTIPHNAHIDGDLAIISHYTLGVRVVDVSDPYNITEVGWYDTYPASDGGGYNGCWGAFPFFGTHPDLFIASDQTNGLFVLEYGGSAATAAHPAAAPGATTLGPAAPNPFRGGTQTRVRLALARPGEVSVQVFDLAGRRVAGLGTRPFPAGVHELAWDGREEGGAPAPTGAYFLRVSTPDGVYSRKAILTR